jgi:hypothetical protein
MKRLARGVLTASALFAVAGSAAAYAALTLEPYQGSRFADVWGEVRSTPYARLPSTPVSVSRFFGLGVSYLKDSAIRTINDQHDVLPHFDKLVHPNGVCLAGSWNITEPSAYSGYFAQGSRGLLIARASVALSDTTRGHFRGFGLAGKLYPTEDPNHPAALETANFFVIDDLGGTMADHYTDAVLTNEPATTIHPSQAIYLASVAAAATAAFKAADINPGIRQVYPIAELGLADPAALRSPKYMKIQGAPGPRSDAPDFRHELDVESYGGHLDFEIYVSEDKQTWQKLGFIDFTDSVASDSCDHRLHFSHPKYRTELDR